MRILVGIAVIASLLAGAVPSNATVSVYTDETAWNTAVAGAGGTVYSEDFQGFAADAPFQSSPVAGSFFTLVQIGSDDFRNLIDVPPLSSSDNGGTSNASMFTNYGAVTVQMSLDDPLFAWGADFYDAGSGEQLDLDLLSGGGTLATLQVPGGDTFFGFVITGPVQTVDQIVFRSRGDSPGPLGEGFGMDNVVGATVAVVPAPGAILLGTLGAGLVGWLRRRRTF